MIDWDWLGQMGERPRVENLLAGKARDAVEYYLHQYEELVLEFHSTYRHKEDAFAERDVVSFSSGRMVHEMTIRQFVVASRFYTAEEVVTLEFLTGLRGAYVSPRELSLGSRDMSQFWATISNHPFAGTNLITSVRNPVYRYVLKIFSTTLVGRKSGENKANWRDLFILMCLVERRNMNLASVLAWSFKRTR
ncbi:hypothetical protein HanOQP8_Chr05g0181431 [Helianthus annuus]|nr:hypothetical protein HanIR_Chr05g0224711 [Helianthus annuus]KAJ0746739.1 hypothetical protein HanOQP8_Chr05g0181431 [Helianthus annuus]